MSITHERKKLWFDGTDLSTFGVYISGSGVFDSPDPDIEFVQMPGRSGDLVRNRNRFSNLTVAYPAAFILSDFDTNFRAIKAFLFSKTDKYYEIEDGYQPDHFRLGVVDAGLSVSDISWSGNAGSFDLRFNCKPQLYLKSGKTEIQLSGSSGSVTNPTQFDALPIIKVVGSGSLTIGGVTVTIAASDLPFVEIDSERMDCYCNGQNANPYVTLSAEKYPTLKPGTSNYQSSGFTSINMIPRWWTL